MFINYWFLVFLTIFFSVYWFVKKSLFRKIWILLASLIFYYHFAGVAGITPILILGSLTYISGLLLNRKFIIVVISICILELIFYKYTSFLIIQSFNLFSPTLAQQMLTKAKESFLPQAPPLSISFFVFEFIHYLVDLYRRKQPIRSLLDFCLFSIFWPSVVSGPVKRFQQFLPSLKAGCSKVSSLDIQIGTLRIVVGLIKKLVIADNLTGYIDYWHPYYSTFSISHRWVFLFAITMRILFDFSGYSDIAIGFARLMGIKLPENFNWPYLATNIQDFWRRWHISLSTWIRDYIYIPMGGNQFGVFRKLSNGIIAFGICGLWHGAALHFVFWGIYHGIGLAISSNTKWFVSNNKLIANFIVIPMNWCITFIFVSIGWLYFFFPIREATSMLIALFK